MVNNANPFIHAQSKAQAPLLVCPAIAFKRFSQSPRDRFVCTAIPCMQALSGGHGSVRQRHRRHHKGAPGRADSCVAPPPPLHSALLLSRLRVYGVRTMGCLGPSRSSACARPVGVALVGDGPRSQECIQCHTKERGDWCGLMDEENGCPPRP